MRMPPIFTNSAVTPALIPLIFCTKAGGNVFSMPKRMPTFLSAINCDLFNVLIRLHEPWTTLAIVQGLEILLCHALPEGPIMLGIISVNVQPVRNSLGMEDG